jgi:hypothetical protein
MEAPTDIQRLVDQAEQLLAEISGLRQKRRSARAADVKFAGAQDAHLQ